MPRPDLPYKTKTMPCRVCGRDLTVTARTRKQPRCVECGIRAMIEQQVQMHNHSGPYWDAWLEANSRRISYESGVTPPT